MLKLRASLIHEGMHLHIETQMGSVHCHLSSSIHLSNCSHTANMLLQEDLEIGYEIFFQCFILGLYLQQTFNKAHNWLLLLLHSLGILTP